MVSTLLLATILLTAPSVSAEVVAEPSVAPGLGEPPMWHSSVAAWDFDEAIRTLEAEGRLTLPVAGRERVLLLEARDFIVDRTIVGAEVGGASRVVGYVTAMPYRGVVEGDEDDLALITIDAARRALIGTIYLDNRGIQVEYHDGEVLAAPTGVMVSTWQEVDMVPPVRRDPIGVLASYNTGIVVVGDSLYAVGDWTTRVTQAFNEQHDMWYQYPALNQWIYSFRTMNHYSTTDADALLAYFKSWTTRFSWPSSVDAFQLFAANDIYRKSVNVIGLGNSIAGDAEKLLHGTSEMVSAVEGWDHSSIDSYNPYNTRHLGIASATELGHNYGEWEHPQNYDSTRGGYNIMAGGTAIWLRSFWFTTQSNGRIIDDSWEQF